MEADKVSREGRSVIRKLEIRVTMLSIVYMYTCSSCSAQPGQHEVCMCECRPGCLFS